MTVNTLSCFGVGLLRAESGEETSERAILSNGNNGGIREKSIWQGGGEGGTESIIHKFPTLWACNRSLIPLRLISRSFPFP